MLLKKFIFAFVFMFLLGMVVNVQAGTDKEGFNNSDEQNGSKERNKPTTN